MSVVLVALVLLSTSLSSIPAPDPGMWTFDNLPIEHLKRVYGFEPTRAWIDHARLSSVRVSSGGSGSFVSAKGLVMTNHHVSLEYINALSTADRDLVNILAKRLGKTLHAVLLNTKVVGMKAVKGGIQARLEGEGQASVFSAPIRQRMPASRKPSRSPSKTAWGLPTS